MIFKCERGYAEGFAVVLRKINSAFGDRVGKRFFGRVVEIDESRGDNQVEFQSQNGLHDFFDYAFCNRNVIITAADKPCSAAVFPTLQ